MRGSDRPAGIEEWMRHTERAIRELGARVRAVGGVAGEATDHGALTGLGDDDHPQYLTNARGDARYDATGAAATAQSAAAADATTKANAAQAFAVQRSNHTGFQTSASISDFTEAAQDAIAALLASGSQISLSYNDAGDSLTISATGADAETMRDTIGAALVGVGNIAVTVNDALDTITISTTATVNSTDAALRDRATHTGNQTASTISDLTEAVQDIVGALVAAGTGITVTYNDAGNVETIALAAHAASHATGGTDPITPASIGAAALPGAWQTLDFSGATTGGPVTSVGAYYTAAYRLVGDRVEFRGRIAFGSAYTAGGFLATLAVGYRPTSKIGVAARAGTLTMFNVSSTGTVSIATAQTLGTEFGLDGIFFVI